jgi:hypothetical protein
MKKKKSDFMWKVSRVWNSIIFWMLHNAVGMLRFLIWDYTKKNDQLLDKDSLMENYTRYIMTDMK